MTLRLVNTLAFIVLLSMNSLLQGCNDRIPQRSTIPMGKQTTDELTCPEGQHEETQVDEESGDEYLACVDDALVRPSGAVIFKQDICICKDGKAISSGNCSATCVGKGDNGKEELIANFNVTSEVALSHLKNVYGWCTTPLGDETSNLKCYLEAKDEDGIINRIDADPIPGTNTVVADVGAQMSYDKTYVLTLVEASSEARSTSTQVIKYHPDFSIPILGPLKPAPISQYMCLVRGTQPDTNGDIYHDSVYQLHFYYLPSIPPTPVPAGTSNLICHDYQHYNYGPNDNELYPRIKNVNNAITLWSITDPRFYDNDNDGVVDIYKIILQKTKAYGGNITGNLNLFKEFRWPGSPVDNDNAGNSSSNSVLGYFMAPWIDTSGSYKSYCLNNSHFNSSNALFKALRDVIEYETEGIYIGERSAEVITGTNGETSVGAKDYIFIRESDLKDVWFYVNNEGKLEKPSDNNVSNVAAYFYYPLNKEHPFTQTITNKLYRVRGANELANMSGGTSNSNGTTSNTVQAHDRKIGCIPKLL